MRYSKCPRCNGAPHAMSVCPALDHIRDAQRDDQVTVFDAETGKWIIMPRGFDPAFDDYPEPGTEVQA